jgi:hypothetical protein
VVAVMGDAFKSTTMQVNTTHNKAKAVILYATLERTNIMIRYSA